MEKEPTEIRPDGTPIYGPPLPDWGKERGQAGWGKAILGVIVLVLAVGIGVWSSVLDDGEPTWQDATIQRAIEGCLPVILVESAAKPEQIDQLTSNLDARAAAIRAQYPDATNIETRVVPVPTNGVVAQKYPGVAHLGVITLERCL